MPGQRDGFRLQARIRREEARFGAEAAGRRAASTGYHGDGDSVPIPRLAWGVGMSDKTIRTALCPGGSERMGRLMRLIEALNPKSAAA